MSTSGAEAEEFDGARLTVHVAADGSYTLIPHADQGDFEVWHHALELAWWRLEHGAKIR